MPVILSEYQSGFQHALNEAEYMLLTDVEISIASFHNDPADTDYQRGFLEGMEAYYKLLGRV